MRARAGVGLGLGMLLSAATGLETSLAAGYRPVFA
jgi:hypothetical protein